MLVKIHSDKFDCDIYIETDREIWHDDDDLSGIPLFYPSEIEALKDLEADEVALALRSKIEFPGTYMVDENGKSHKPDKATAKKRPPKMVEKPKAKREFTGGAAAALEAIRGTAKQVSKNKLRLKE